MRRIAALKSRKFACHGAVWAKWRKRSRAEVAAQRRAVDRDELAGEVLARALELVDPRAQRRLAGAGLPGEQQRVARAARDLFELVDHLVERGVARIDAGLEQRRARGLAGAKPGGEAVVLRELEIDHVDPAGGAAGRRLATRPRRRLQQHTRHCAGLAQKEQADLDDVGPGMSRTRAKKTFTLADHAAATAGVECRKDADVIDETPGAYKSIDDVMAAQADLVDIVYTLKQIVCVKG
jgi:hypothetical protein